MTLFAETDDFADKARISGRGRETSSIWNETAVAILRRMVEEGRSAREAGLALGCSRNAAMGKANRLGLQFRSNDRRPMGMRSVAKPRPSVPRLVSGRNRPWTMEDDAALRQHHQQRWTARQSGLALGRSATAVAQRRKVLKLGCYGVPLAPISPDVITANGLARANARGFVEPASLNLPLEELTNHTCKFMAGDPHDAGAGFCGHETVPEKPWCPFHHGIVFRPAGVPS